MEHVRDQRVAKLVESCVDLSPNEQLGLLDRECNGDQDLRARVEAALRSRLDSDKTQAFTNDYKNSLPGHYRLIRMIGRGGMAEVFLAEDTRLSRNVAIKFLNSEFRRNPERMRRFHQEARAASALNHPNIIVIYDIGENGGVQHIVSEYVNGETLGTKISRGRIGLEEAVSIGIQIASALAATHRAGIVHRDLKPDNVMVRDDGTVKVLDFGLAKETGHLRQGDADRDAKTLDKVSTAAGLIMGTPQYMSPEQARGYPLDARTDIFSHGIIIFEMVTGRPPFAGHSMADTIAAIVSQEPRRLEEYLDDPPLSLLRIIQKALRKNRDERYGTMEHLLSDLKDLRGELQEQQYFGRETGGTQARATLQKTARTAAVKSVAWEKLLVLPVILIAAAATWWFFKDAPERGQSAQATLRTIGITSWDSGPGEALGAASFSPSAEMVAFAATRSGATEIWVKPVVGGDAIQVTKSGFYNQYPVWSPDGREIAFFSSRGEDRGLWRASFTGGTQTLVLSGLRPSARPVYWAKSGKIYFQEGPDLYSFDTSSNERSRVTNFETATEKPRIIEISADESTIAYSVREDENWKLKIKPLNGEKYEEVASSKGQFDYIAWRPDGKSVVYSGSVDGAFQVFRAGVGLGEPIQLSNGNVDFFVHDISADGTKILYGSVRETSDLWRINTGDGTEASIANDVSAEYWADTSPDGKSVAFQSVTQVDRPYSGAVMVRGPSASAPATVVAASGFSPRWSNDGEWVAYYKRIGNGIEIWRARPTGDEPVRLSTHAADAPSYTPTPYLKVGTNYFSWSPTSDRIAYSATVDKISNIWTASADGSRNEQVTSNTDPKESYSCPVWTPDGLKVAFISELPVNASPSRTGFRIWLRDLGTREQRVLFESTEQFRFLGLTDDGLKAIVTQRADPKDLAPIPKSTAVYSISLKTGERSAVNNLDSVYIHNIHLSRDGRSLAFVSRRDDVTSVWTAPLNGGAPHKLLEEKDPKIMVSSLAWSPDGSFIIFGKQTRTSLLSMLAK